MGREHIVGDLIHPPTGRILHACVFLPNATMSGATSNCWHAQAVPVNPAAGLYFVEDQQCIKLVAARASQRKTPGEMAVATLALDGFGHKTRCRAGGSLNAARAWRSASAPLSAAITGRAACTAASMRGQSNFGNRAVMVSGVGQRQGIATLRP